MAIGVPTFLLYELLGAAVLALWVVARFPKVGPHTLRTSLGISALALLVLRCSPLGVAPMLRLPYGQYAALIGFVLPVFFAAFLAAAWLMRALAASLGGSGGGGLPVSNSGR